MPNMTRRVDRLTAQLEHSCGYEPGWMGKGALDSRCDENDRESGSKWASDSRCGKRDGGFESNQKTLGDGSGENHCTNNLKP